MRKILCLLLLLPLLSVAQNNRLYTTQHGLATSNINSLMMDSHGVIWIASNADLAYFDGAGFHYLPNRNPKTGQPYYTTVNRIYEDKDDCYWVLTNAGLYYFDSRHVTYKRILLNHEETDMRGYSVTQMLDVPGSKTEKILITAGYGLFYLDTEKQQILDEKSAKLQQNIKASWALCGCIDNEGYLWVGTIDYDIIRYDLKNNKRIPIRMTEEAAAHSRVQTVNRIANVKPFEAIYMATQDGMMKYNERTDQIEYLHQTAGHPYTGMLFTQSGELLLATDSYGVLQIDANDQVSTFELEHQVYDLSTGKVRDMVQDPDGNIIMALLQKGIFIIPRNDSAFRYHSISLKGNGKNSSCITSLKIDKEGNYWIATDGAGVFKTDGTHMGTAHPINEGLRSLLIQSVELDREDGVWVASYGGGVQCYDKSAGRFVTPEWLSELKDKRVLSLAMDKVNGILYAGTSGLGVYAINLFTHSIHKVQWEDQQGEWITAVYVDPDHTLWIAELGAVGYINLTTGVHGQLKRELGTYDTQCISSMGEGANKQILLGSANGLLCYNPKDGSSKRLLENKPVLSINQTEKYIWVASANSIYSIDKKTYEISNYNSMGGYYIGEFHRGASLDNQVGNILFGCDNGIVCFTPGAIRSDRKIRNEILFTSLRAAGKELHYSDSTEYMDADIMYAQCINLKHTENTFSIYFNVPNFSQAHQIHYEYKLEGYEDNWNKCTDVSTQRASYTYLAPGTYTLRVKAHLEGTPESTIEKCIEIHIGAPWYATTLAKICYLLLLVGLYFLIRRILSNRKQQRRALHQALHSEEIKEAKLRLFTSITHELRTPLTMIISPIKHLMTKATDEETIKDLNAMKHNCDRLLDIVKQITDIRKIDAGQFMLHFEEVDMCNYTHEVAQSFMGAAAAKHINFSIENHESAISVWIDPVHFEKIIVNILSNAFKFCPEGGRILIRNQRVGNCIELSIFNAGSHINEEDMKHIFERFYQSETGQKHVGSGIGLNLAYELVQLHHGKITAVNTEPDGVEFTIRIPSGCAHLSAEELEPRPTEEHDTKAAKLEVESNKQTITTRVEEIHREANTNEGSSEDNTLRQRPHLLIVDDSRELCEYLREQLASDYNITLAFGGTSAWNIILQTRPDLIITDMKMPDGDGIELCRRVKSNPEFDHTPIIMLTGEGSENLQLESLNMHVDYYMQKPFNMSILQGVVRQLIEVRENLKRHIQRKEINTDYENVELPSIEDQLFERITETVLKHLDDDGFGVQELANEVGISRVHLNRKMKEKYGMSPNVFIKTYRLKQAAYLLLHKHVNVSEVAYRVGFSTHSYFSSSFREFFGMTPKDFVTYYMDPANADKLEKILE